MLQNYEELLEKKRELIEATKKLDEYAVGLLDRKRVLLDEIDEITVGELKPRKEEISQIDAEIENIMKQTGQDRIVSESYGAYLSSEVSVKVTDKDKAWRWVQNHPQVLKKDILKVSEVNKLLKEGIVPDPSLDGVDCNDTYEKITFRRI